MEIDHSAAAEIAKHFFGITAPPTRLGWGISGHVFLSPDLRTAVKVHRREESFTRELEVYQILRKHRITQLHGLTIPKLRGHRRDMKLIQMDFVNSPYLLDFAGVRYTEPDFSPDTMEAWHADIAEKFRPNEWIVYAVYNSLSKYGLYYIDFRPSNLNITGLPGAEPVQSSGDEEMT